MNAKLLILPLFLAGTLASIYVLPEAGQVADTAVLMDLPRKSGPWEFRNIPASKEELGALAKDTRFSKAICLSPRFGEIAPDGRYVPDRVDLSIVFSGYDLNNSIHRPERCMVAQGHKNLVSSDLTLRLRNGREVSMRRLRSEQRQAIQTADGGAEERELNCVTYYFFVGHDRLVYDHLERTLLDMKDRLVRGMDQRWAYVSASTWYGDIPWIEGEVSEEEADRKLQGFLSDLLENQIKWDQIRS